jgi:uncharacterized protein YfaP (DUF2135 family)
MLPPALFLPRSVVLLAVLAGLLALPACDSNDPVDDLIGNAIVTGLVTDSQEGEPVADAVVRFTRGNAFRETTTNATGTFNIPDLATGTFTVRITSPNFFEAILENVVITAGTNTIPPVVVAQAPPAGSYRIVLTWGQTPSDLDSHLTGPDGANGRFHVYFASSSPVPFANLDRDDTTSFGPETVTLEPRHNGIYRYSVHNYSQRNNLADAPGGIFNSPARVQVYSSQGLVNTFTAPQPPAGTQANTWRVFEMTRNGTQISITPVNTYVNADYTNTGHFRPAPKAGGQAPALD